MRSSCRSLEFWGPVRVIRNVGKYEGVPEAFEGVERLVILAFKMGNSLLDLGDGLRKYIYITTMDKN